MATGEDAGRAPRGRWRSTERSEMIGLFSAGAGAEPCPRWVTTHERSLQSSSQRQPIGASLLAATASLADRTPVPQGTWLWLAQLPEAEITLLAVFSSQPAIFSSHIALAPAFNHQSANNIFLSHHSVTAPSSGRVPAGAAEIFVLVRRSCSVPGQHRACAARAA